MQFGMGFRQSWILDQFLRNKLLRSLYEAEELVSQDAVGNRTRLQELFEKLLCELDVCDIIATVRRPIPVTTDSESSDWSLSPQVMSEQGSHGRGFCTPEEFRQKRPS